MGWVSLACAAVAAAALAAPADGMFAALGLGLLSAGAGLVAYRRREAAGWARLAGAGAVTLGGIAAALAAAKIGLTFVAVSALEQLVS